MIPDSSEVSFFFYFLIFLVFKTLHCPPYTLNIPVTTSKIFLWQQKNSVVTSFQTFYSL